MEIRNNAEALNALLGVKSSEATKSVKVKDAELNDRRTAFAGDEATLSGIGAAMQSASGSEGVRLDKVAAVQQALATGTYKVDASKVADNLMDAMLGTAIHVKGE